MKFNLKKFLKTIKLNESTISMVLGVVVIVVTAILVVNYFKDRSNGSIPTDGANVTEQASKNYTVKKGDSLWSIAEKETGSGYNWVKIASENKISDPSVITEGQSLVIPAVEEKTIENPFLGNTAKVDSISGATYEVNKGDSLWSIAVRAYGDGYKWVEIARENHLVNPNIIHSGNLLALPR